MERKWIRCLLENGYCERPKGASSGQLLDWARFEVAPISWIPLRTWEGRSPRQQRHDRCIRRQMVAAVNKGSVDLMSYIDL